MPFAILGIIIGLAVSLGPLAVLARPLDWVTNWLVGTAGDLITSALDKLAGLPHTSQLSVSLAAVFGAVTPGLVAVLLVVASRSAKKVRQWVAGASVVVGIASLFLLPLGQALLLLLLAGVVCVLPSVIEGAFITLPLIAFATVIGVRYGVLLWTGKSSEVAAGALKLALITDASTLNLWKVALTVVGLVPFGLAAWRALFKD